jgi:hypothetical protein
MGSDRNVAPDNVVCIETMPEALLVCPATAVCVTLNARAGRGRDIYLALV